MPTGQPDPHFLPQERSDRFLPQERSDVGGGAPKGRRGSSSLNETQQEYAASADVVHGHAERLIRKAMEAGEFDDLAGTGEPIPGAGGVDDELWWVRSWLKRNQDQQSPNSP